MFGNIFANITVLDLTHVFSGPLATRMLSDYGARVIKIESNHHPDPSRTFPPFRNGVSGYYELLNRGKEFCEIDLKESSGRNTFYSLCKDADVIVENMAPSVKKKLLIDYEVVKKCNKKIIYASLSGIDQRTDRKYFDVIAQAESGLMSLSGNGTHPVKVGPAIVDAYSGMNLAFSIVSGLYKRSITNEGMFIEVSMLASSINLLEQNLIEYSIEGKIPETYENQDNAISPFGIFSTKDGSIVLAIGSDSMWRKFVDVMANNETLISPKFETNNLRLKNISKLQLSINTLFSEYTTSDLIERLNKAQIPVALVRNMKDVAEDKALLNSHSIIPYKHSKLGSIITTGRSIIFHNDTHVKKYKESPHSRI